MNLNCLYLTHFMKTTISYWTTKSTSCQQPLEPVKILSKVYRTSKKSREKSFILFICSKVGFEGCGLFTYFSLPSYCRENSASTDNYEDADGQWRRAVIPSIRPTQLSTDRTLSRADEWSAPADVVNVLMSGWAAKLWETDFCLASKVLLEGRLPCGFHAKHVIGCPFFCELKSVMINQSFQCYVGSLWVTLDVNIVSLSDLLHLDYPSAHLVRMNKWIK